MYRAFIDLLDTSSMHGQNVECFAFDRSMGDGMTTSQLFTITVGRLCTLSVRVCKISVELTT